MTLKKFSQMTATERQEHINVVENVDKWAEVTKIIQKLKLEGHQIGNLQEAFYNKFPQRSLYDALIKLDSIKPFAAGGNLWSSGQTIDEPTLFAMRWVAGLKFSEVLDVLKFDQADSNLVQDLSVGNIGTAQRWTKTVTGDSLECDNEMMCGRYATPPRIATFPSDEEEGSFDPVNGKAPITKRFSLISTCSHHFLAYGTTLSEDAVAFISYIPGDYVLGISKLQRLADWVARRPTIQEDLTKAIYDEICEAAGTKDVFVFIGNALHTCEYLRGAMSHDSGFTTMHFGGAYEDKALRDSVIRSVVSKG